MQDMLIWSRRKRKRPRNDVKWPSNSRKKRKRHRSWLKRLKRTSRNSEIIRKNTKICRRKLMI